MFVDAVLPKGMLSKTAMVSEWHSYLRHLYAGRFAEMHLCRLSGDMAILLCMLSCGNLALHAVMYQGQALDKSVFSL